MTAAPRFVTAVCASTLTLLAACSKPPTDAPVDPASARAPVTSTNELSSGAADDATAESGLAIKRGIASAAGDHALFRSCEDKSDLWLVDEADGTLTELLTESGAASFYVEAYGERGPVPEHLSAAKGHAGVFVLEQLLYAASGEGRGCDEQAASDYVVTARGNEPFWSITIAGPTMVWKQPEAPQELSFPGYRAEGAEGTMTYDASSEQGTLQLVVAAQPCRDSMSGEFFAFAAKGQFNGRELKGCARVGSREFP
jgi:uncharacterized membrane protein